MLVSFDKYGPAKENYGKGSLGISAIDNLKKRLQLYEYTGNIEYLVDVANFAMIEFMHPNHSKAHFNDRSESPGLGKITYRDIANM